MTTNDRTDLAFRLFDARSPSRNAQPRPVSPIMIAPRSRQPSTRAKRPAIGPAQENAARVVGGKAAVNVGEANVDFLGGKLYSPPLFLHL